MHRQRSRPPGFASRHGSIPTGTTEAMANADKASAPSHASAGREWMPHIWHGMDFFAWMRLLARNRFAVHFSCLHIAVIVTIVSVFHSLLRLVEDVIYGTRVRRTRLPEPPLFIIGH